MEINMHINQYNWLNKKTNEGNKKYLWKINKIDKPLLRGFTGTRQPENTRKAHDTQIQWLSPLHRRGNWGSERGSQLPTVPHPGRSRNWAQKPRGKSRSFTAGFCCPVKPSRGSPPLYWPCAECFPHTYPLHPPSHGLMLPIIQMEKLRHTGFK